MVPEYLFSTTAFSEITTSLETAPQNVALVYATCTSVTNSQNVFPISAETSLSSLSTLHYSDTSPERITASNL
jgi:hypothetical protein